MDYGSIVYSSASVSHLKKLDTIQSSALRIATGAFRSSPIVALETETNIPPLSYWRQIQITSWFLKTQNSAIDHPNFQLFSREFNSLQHMDWSSGRNVPFIIRSCYQLTYLNLSWGSFSPIPIISPLPLVTLLRFF